MVDCGAITIYPTTGLSPEEKRGRDRVVALIRDIVLKEVPDSKFTTVDEVLAAYELRFAVPSGGIKTTRLQKMIKSRTGVDGEIETYHTTTGITQHPNQIKLRVLKTEMFARTFSRYSLSQILYIVFLFGAAIGIGVYLAQKHHYLY